MYRLTKRCLVFGCLLHDLLCVWISVTLKWHVHTWLILTPLVFGTLLMIDLQVSVCASLLCVSSCDLTARKKTKNKDKETRNKRMERELWNKWVKRHSARCHFVRSHLLLKWTNTPHALTHCDTQQIRALYVHTACGLHLQDFIHSVTKLEKKTELVSWCVWWSSNQNARSYCVVWCSLAFAYILKKSS